MAQEDLNGHAHDVCAQMAMVSPMERKAVQQWHKGGWEIVKSPPPLRGAGVTSVSSEALPMRGGWPAAGTYTSSPPTGNFGWYAEEPPPPAAPKSSPAYTWHHQQFLRPTA